MSDLFGLLEARKVAPRMPIDRVNDARDSPLRSAFDESMDGLTKEHLTFANWLTEQER